VEIVAVDSAGSVALGGAPGPRRLTGIGSSQRSRFLRPWMYDEQYAVDDVRAIAVCRALRDAGGPWVGGSSGAALAACLEHLERNPQLRHPVVICPDHGRSYADTLYDDAWLAGAGLDAGLGRAERQLFAAVPQAATTEADR
jgi:cysteine synthase A